MKTTNAAAKNTISEIFKNVLSAQEGRDASERITVTIGTIVPKLQARVVGGKSLTKAQGEMFDAASDGARAGAIYGALMARETLSDIVARHDAREAAECAEVARVQNAHMAAFHSKDGVANCDGGCRY